jgi:hypothetical protein
MLEKLWGSTFWDQDLPRIGIFIGINVVGFFTAWVIPWIMWKSLRACDVPRTYAAIVQNTFKVLILVFFILVSLAAIEVTLSALITTLGIAALIITYALSSVISDIFHGLRLQYMRQVRIGDYVQSFVGYESVRGHVIEFTLTQMCIRTGITEVKYVAYTPFIQNSYCNFTHFPDSGLMTANFDPPTHVYAPPPVGPPAPKASGGGTPVVPGVPPVATSAASGRAVGDALYVEGGGGQEYDVVYRSVMVPVQVPRRRATGGPPSEERWTY